MNNLIVLPTRQEHPPEVASTREKLLVMLNATQERGMTWTDVAAALDTSHGSASGLLSSLHAAGVVARLAERREGCRIYVLPRWVLGRATERRGRTTYNALLDDMAEMLRSIPTRCRHQEWRMHCRSCEIRNLLVRYDNR